ncbi:MAG: hypothetical protein AB1384_09080 [Actinomycetota bacterium]
MPVKPLRLVYILLPALALAIIPLTLPGVPPAAADTVNSPLQYSMVMTRYYKSSIDGATLPCSIYVPGPDRYSKGNLLSLWVDLHAFGGHGGISSDPANSQTAAADACGMAIIAPWGRNFKSMYGDAVEGAAAPLIYDDFTGAATGWAQENGSWAVNGGAYRQGDAAMAWKNTVRASSSGSDYTVSVRLREEPNTGGISAMGVTFRRQGSSDYYQVDLCDWAGVLGRGRELRLYKRVGYNWVPLAEDPFNWKDGEWYELKVNAFQEYIEVHVDSEVHNLDASYRFHSDGSEAPYRADSAFKAGSVGLASFGACHQFDDFRLQNDFLYGESDIMDCIQQFMEEVSVDPARRIDPSRVFVSGYSMGGLGTWGLGLHYPDVFTALHPSYASTDLEEGYRWIASQFPDPDKADPTIFPGINPALYVADQDVHIGEALRSFLGCEPSGITEGVRSQLRENSARFILENALNSSVRIEHPEYDVLIPNTTSLMNIWWSLASGALARMRSSTPTYAHSKYIWQKWLQYPSLSKGLKETSGYGADGGAPADPGNIWDSWDYSAHAKFGDLTSPGAKAGAHGNGYVNPAFMDAFVCSRITDFFRRADAALHAERANPGEVAYKTYDNRHTRAWWLSIEPAYPDANNPGLARVRRTPASNGAAVHAKNVKTLSLDVVSMGLNTSPGAVITMTMDSNTAPEAEPVADSWKKTDLKLVGTWWPSADYKATLNGAPVNCMKTGTSLTVEGIPLSASPATLQVTIPAGLANLIANPGFESGTAGWTPGNHLFGGGTGTFELTSTAATGEAAHSGGYAVRIKDARANGWPFISSWDSSPVAVTAGASYTASAFAKTRVLGSTTRLSDGGKYNELYTSNAGVAILWLNASGTPVSLSSSTGFHGSRDWTPVQITAACPANAAYAKVIVFTINPNQYGASGSAFFDDVALRRN